MKNRPRVILICCEGATEKAYFEIISKHYRITSARINIVGEGGSQHKALIDRTVEERTKLADELDLETDDILSWAVCDDDGMTIPYPELQNYARAHDVELAFSSPQFEAFLLQHFEQSGEIGQDALLKKLSEYKNSCGNPVAINKTTKADLGWLRQAIFEKPKLIETAIINANQRTHHQKGKPFFTVQMLVEYLKSLEVR